jgi:hypothetical protein
MGDSGELLGFWSAARSTVLGRCRRRMRHENTSRLRKRISRQRRGRGVSERGCARRREGGPNPMLTAHLPGLASGGGVVVIRIAIRRGHDGHSRD